MSPYGWYVRFPGELLLLASTRDLIDWGVRGRVAALPNVRIHQGADVAGLIRGPGDGARVAGVRLRSRTADAEVDRGGAELAADLVVVADGRNSRLPEWLTALGYEPPEETVVNSFQGYASRLYRPPAEFESDWKALYIQQAPPDDPRGGLVSRSRGALARLAGRRRRRLPAHRRGRLPRLRPQPAEPGALRGDRGGRAVDPHRRPARDREPPAALRPPRAVPRRGRGRGRRRLRVQPGLRPGDDRRGAGSRSPGPLVAGGVVAPRSGSRSRLPASPGPGDRRRLAALRGRGLPLPDHGGAAPGSGRATDRLLHRRGDAGRHEAAVGPATAGGGAPPAPPPVGAVRPRRPGPPGVGPARGPGRRRRPEGHAAPGGDGWRRSAAVITGETFTTMEFMRWRQRWQSNDDGNQ